VLRIEKSGRLRALLVSAIFAIVCIAASRTVVAVDFTPHGTQPGMFFLLDEPQACLGCHGANNPPNNAFVPHATWSGSLMSHATRDPLFWAALDVAERDVPGVGDWCLRCHSPVGWLGGRVSKTGKPGGPVNGTNGCLLQGSFTEGDSPLDDYAGVTCHLCHRMQALGPSAESAPPGSGNYWLDDTASCGFSPCRQGPYNYEVNDELEPPHVWRYSAFTTSGEHCGTCHDVSSPITDAGTPARTLIVPNATPAGRDTGRAFPAERTYSEWKHSSYGDSLLVDSFERGGAAVAKSVNVTDCQDCHMRNSSSANARACLQNPYGSRTGNLSVHEFVGGGAWPLRMIKGLYGSVLGSGRVAAIEQAIGWSEELLAVRSAALDVTLAPWTPGSGDIQASVRVTNLAGHKLPTGYPEGRRMWLLVEAHDANGVPIFTSGAWNSVNGDLASDPQLKVYEVLQGIWDTATSACKITDALGNKKFHFALNNCVALDNRIPPLGFKPVHGGDPEGLDMSPVGYVYPETSPGSGTLVNYDVTSYSVPVPNGTPTPITVRATLQYQTSSKDYIAFLRNQAVDNAQPSENAMCGRSWTEGPANKSRGQFLMDLWDDPAYGRSAPLPMALDTASTTP
jgi:hypothetical protein